MAKNKKPEDKPKTPIPVQDLLLNGAYAVAALNIGRGIAEGHEHTSAIVEALEAGVERLRLGDIGAVEEILFVELQLLHSLTNRWLMKALNSNNPDVLKTFAGLALKSQEQARKTGQVIAEIKNPKRVQFIRSQLNQLNVNGDSHAQMDAAIPRKRGGALPSEPTLDKVHWTEDGSRETKVEPEFS